MHKLKYLFIVVIFIPVITWGACTGSSPTWSCTTVSCSSETDVNSCISGATAGDTINFAAGTYTYGAILLNKAVSLIGAGVDSSIINGGSTLSITPASYTDTTNLYRVSGFTFNGGRRINLGTDYYNVAAIGDSPALPKVRVDNNKLVGLGVGSSPQAFWNYGTLQGVVDNNIIEDYGYPIRNLPGVDYTQRALDRFNYIYPHWDTGNDYVIIFEDNTFTGINYGGVDSILSDSGVGGVFVFRYNTITADTPGSPLFDWHGYTTGQASSFAGELYGNLINATGSFVRARGGKAMIHHNSAVGATMTIEYYSGVSSGDTNACPAQYTAAQMMHDTYSWLNRRDATGALMSNTTTFTIGGTCLGLSGIPTAGRDYYGDGTTPGISCGTLVAIPGTCTVGQGYWATAQSCSNLTGMVGVSPSTPISGTLYKCTATDTWTAFYTPYTYPHPLRGESDTTAPTNNQAGNSINSDGDELTMNYSESVVKTGSGTLSLTCSGGAITPTYSSGSGSANHLYTLSRVVNQGEVCTVSYTQGGNDLEDASGNDLATYSDHTIVNGSGIQTETTYEFSITVVGNGTITSSQGGIQCHQGNTPCTKTCDSGTVLTLTATPDNGWGTGTISGASCGSTTTMSAARTCTVTFPEIHLLN